MSIIIILELYVSLGSSYLWMKPIERFVRGFWAPGNNELLQPSLWVLFVLPTPLPFSLPLPRYFPNPVGPCFTPNDWVLLLIILLQTCPCWILMCDDAIGYNVLFLTCSFAAIGYCMLSLLWLDRCKPWIIILIQLAIISYFYCVNY